ncbi:MAG: ACP dehydratase [Proteobacteria bacterium]|nr:ACP dehydratase [Pseudomonadota bacterium]MBU1716729.1 ACP dehydratase [Pseudomonadota bacterium]
MPADNILHTNDTIPDLPCSVLKLVPQRPPMLLVDRLLSRDLAANFSVVEASVPIDGIFVEQGRELLPEYFVELVAQAMAAVNGYDGLVAGKDAGRGFLVGINDFSWHGTAALNESLRIELKKTFEFGPVTVMAGQVFNGAGQVLARGEIKAWEGK